METSANRFWNIKDRSRVREHSLLSNLQWWVVREYFFCASYAVLSSDLFCLPVIGDEYLCGRQSIKTTIIRFKCMGCKNLFVASLLILFLPISLHGARYLRTHNANRNFTNLSQQRHLFEWIRDHFLMHACMQYMWDSSHCFVKRFHKMIRPLLLIEPLVSLSRLIDFTW